MERVRRRRHPGDCRIVRVLSRVQGQAHAPRATSAATCPIVPAGQEPEREYHRLQPIQSDPKARTEAERLESLRKAACKIDADAVIEAVNEEVRGDNAQYADGVERDGGPLASPQRDRGDAAEHDCPSQDADARRRAALRRGRDARSRARRSTRPRPALRPPRRDAPWPQAGNESDQAARGARSLRSDSANTRAGDTVARRALVGERRLVVIVLGGAKRLRIRGAR